MDGSACAHRPVCTKKCASQPWEAVGGSWDPSPSRGGQDPAEDTPRGQRHCTQGKSTLEGSREDLLSFSRERRAAGCAKPDERVRVGKSEQKLSIPGVVGQVQGTAKVKAERTYGEKHRREMGTGRESREYCAKMFKLYSVRNRKPRRTSGAGERISNMIQEDDSEGSIN